MFPRLAIVTSCELYRMTGSAESVLGYPKRNATAARFETRHMSIAKGRGKHKRYRVVFLRCLIITVNNSYFTCASSKTRLELSCVNEGLEDI